MARRLIATRVLVALVFAPGSAAFAQSEHAAPHCAPVEGAGMTNLAVINQATTLGTQTGDLAGAVSVVILSVTPGANGTTVFKVQHHFVTEAGYSITAAPPTRRLLRWHRACSQSFHTRCASPAEPDRLPARAARLMSSARSSCRIFRTWPAAKQCSATVGNSATRHQSESEVASRTAPVARLRPNSHGNREGVCAPRTARQTSSVPA